MTQEAFELDCDDQTRLELLDLFRSHGVQQSDIRAVQRRNLDGSTATWIVLATLTSQLVPHLLNFLVAWPKTRTVTRIKVGEIEIENPTPEDLALLRARFGERSATRESE